MSGRERMRRTLIWGAVALFFVAAISAVFTPTGGWFTLTAFCAYPVVGAR